MPNLFRRVAALLPDGVRGGPPACSDVIITPAEADETQVPVVQAAREAEGQAQIRIGVLNDGI